MPPFVYDKQNIQEYETNVLDSKVPSRDDELNEQNYSILTGQAQVNGGKHGLTCHNRTYKGARLHHFQTSKANNETN